MAKSFDVSYRFLAIDAFTAVGEKVSASVNNIKRSIVDIQKTTDNSSRTFRKLADSIGVFGSKIKSFGKTLSTHVSLPMAALGTNMIRLANIQAQAEAKLTLGLENYRGTAKLTFAELMKSADELQKRSLFGDEDITAKVTVPLLKFRGLGEKEFSRAQQAIVDIAATTGRDLNRISVQVGRALNKPLEALTTLEQSGLDFNLPGLKGTLKLLAESGKNLLAQQLILTIIEQQVGGTALALTKIGTGPLVQIWNTIGDINKEIGKELIEILEPLIRKIKSLVDRLDSLTDGQRRFLAWAVAIGAVIGPVLVGIAALALGIKGLSLAFAFLSISMIPVILPLIKLALVIGIVYVAFKLISGFLKTHFPNVLTAIGEKILWFKDGLIDLKNTIVDFFSFGNMGGKLISGLTNLFGSIGEFGLEKSQSFDELFQGGKAQEQAAHAFETKFNVAALERDSADININLKSPENVIESVSSKSSGRMNPKVGMQMIDG